MNLKSAESSLTSSALLWERLMAQTRYGRYADGVESTMMRYVLAQHPTPGVLFDVGCEGGALVKGLCGLWVANPRDGCGQRSFAGLSITHSECPVRAG